LTLLKQKLIGLPIEKINRDERKIRMFGKDVHDGADDQEPAAIA
jgi:hypothetical protein